MVCCACCRARKGAAIVFRSSQRCSTVGTETAGIAGSELEQFIVAQTPLGRVGQPDEVASIVVFLASNDSGWLTGERMIASGGMR